MAEHRQLRGDFVEAVAALKNEPGGDIGMSGSPSIVRQLLEAGLLDELHLFVHPLAVRPGMQLFDSGPSIPLKLLSTQTFSTGVLYWSTARTTHPPGRLRGSPGNPRPGRHVVRRSVGP